MSVLYMIRHGQASWGAANYDCLSELGRVQAGVLGEFWATHGPDLDAVYTGTLERHRDTAAPLFPALVEAGRAEPPLAEEPLFNEFDAMGVWQHQIAGMIAEDPSVGEDLKNAAKDTRAMARVFQKAMTKWAAGEVDPNIVPSWTDFTGRVQEGLEKIMDRHQSGKKVAIFTSGGTISSVVQSSLGLSHEKTMECATQIYNASVTRFQYSGGRIMLFGFNDAAHLEMADRRLLTRL